MKDLIFPRITIDSPSEPLIRCYTQIMQKKEAGSLLPYTAVFCAIAVAAGVFALTNPLAILLYSLPAAWVVFINVFIFSQKRWFWLGGLLFLLSVENMVVVCGLLLFYQNSSQLLAAGVYYAVLLANFIWVVICYRLKYRKFEAIALLRGEIARKASGKPKAGGLLSGIVVVAVARLIAGTFSPQVIGVGCLYLIGYYLNPIIAERLVVVRQYSQMKPHLMKRE